MIKWIATGSIENLNDNKAVLCYAVDTQIISILFPEEIFIILIIQFQIFKHFLSFDNWARKNCVQTGKIHFAYALVCSRAITCLSWQSLPKTKQSFFYSVSQKKKKRKKKLGKETNGTWLRRGILLALNAQSNVCSKKVFNQTEKVVSVIAQACAIKAVDLFESTATEFWIYVFIYVSLHLRFYCKRILLKKTINHLQPLKSKPNVKIYFAKKC